MITQFFGETILKRLLKTGNTSLQLQAGSRFRVGGLGAELNTALNLDFSGNGIGGLDVGAIAANTLYYIYAVISANSVSLVASLSPSGPSGFTIFRELGKVISNTNSNISDPVRFGDEFSHFLRFEVSNGFGSTHTLIRKFNTVAVDEGAGLLAYDTTAFAEFGTALTPLFDCLVQGLRSDQSVGSVTEFWGVSFDTDPLQAFNAKGVDTMLGPKGNFVSGVDYINIPLMGKVLAGQIIRPHHNSAVTMAAVSATNGLFEITATAKYEDVI